MFRPKHSYFSARPGVHIFSSLFAPLKIVIVREGFTAKLKFRLNLGANIYLSIYFPKQKYTSKVSLIIFLTFWMYRFWPAESDASIAKIVRSILEGYRMVNPRLCETVRPLFKNPKLNFKSSRLRDWSTCSGPEIPRLEFRMPIFRDWVDIFRDASFSHRPFYSPSRALGGIARIQSKLLDYFSMFVNLIWEN